MPLLGFSVRLPKRGPLRTETNMAKMSHFSSWLDSSPPQYPHRILRTVLFKMAFPFSNHSVI